MKTKYIILIVVVICVLALVGGLTGWLVTRGDTSGLLVSTNVGFIRGFRNEDGFFSFLGVPYGQVGKNIFGNAEPHPAFDDIFEANQSPEQCVQMSSNGAVGSMDCLKLNIFVPDSDNNDERFPVMVYIHGGAFVEGRANTQSQQQLALIKQGVIIIHVQYRLGVFGFMCLDIPEVPGNTGLKDQTLALRWINENIEAFGGDTSRITLFGNSAGAVAINLHLYSQDEKLFESVIIMSGPANSYWTMVKSDNTIPIRIANELGYSTENIYDALAFLEDVNVQTIAKTAYDLKISNSDGVNEPLTKPCVEQQFEGVEHFLTEHPMKTISSKASTTPIIIGITDNELAFSYGFYEAEYFDTYDFGAYFPLGLNMSSEDLDEALEVIRYFYIGDEVTSKALQWQLTDFASDFLFNHPNQRMIQMLVDNGADRVYSYRFSYDGKTWFCRDKTWTGAGHAEELMYLFDICLSQDADYVLLDRLTSLWANFAKYGEPTPTTSELLPVKWTTIPRPGITLPYLEINSDLKMDSRPFHDRMAFWDLFYLMYGHYEIYND